MRQVVRWALLVVLCAATGTARAQGSTFLVFNSEPGDFIGQGLRFTLTPADGTFIVNRSGGGVLVGFSSGSQNWTLSFTPRSGGNLTPGAYENALRFQTATAPALDISGNGRGCNTVAGRFTVLEAEYDAGGAVLKLAVDYEQHCDGGAPALFGSVRYASSVPTVPHLAVGPVTRYEGDDASSSLGFVVSLSGPAETAVTVQYATVDGTATAGSDYGPVSGTATFPVGETTVAVPVPVLGDTVEEPDETFTLALSNGVGAPIAVGQGLGTLLNDDPNETYLHFHSEPGDYIGGGLTFTLTPADGAITFGRMDGGIYASFEGSTSWTVILVPPSGAVLTPGAYEGATRWPFQSPTKPGLSVSGNGRACNTVTGRFVVYEAEYGTNGEVLKLAADYEQHCEGAGPALFGSVRYLSAVESGPRLYVGPATTWEGDGGTSSLWFVVALSAPAAAPVTVNYATVDGTATAGSDYTATSGLAAFSAGQTAVAVPVPVRGDTEEEGDETLTLSLNNPVGAPIAIGQGQGTILNDDPYKTLLRFDSEPGDYIGGGGKFTLTPADGVISANAASGGVRVEFNGSTWWDLYFVPPSGRPLTPGVYEGATRYPFQSPTMPGLSVSGASRGCNVLSGRFTVLEAEFAASGQVVRLAIDYEQHCEKGEPALYGSVRYNSSVPLGTRLSVSGVSRYEWDEGPSNLGFVVSLSAPAQTVVTVGYQTVDGTASAGSDYTAVSGTVTFPVGETAVTVPVVVQGDLVEETDETFTLRLDGAAGAPVAFGEGQGTILNDDPYKSLIYFNSEPGDWIGQGQKFTVTPAHGTFGANLVTGGVHVGFDGEMWWDVNLATASGVMLTPGIYLGAMRYPFQTLGAPGLDVSGSGRGCNTLTGRFTVLEVEYGAAGEVLRFAADYEQHCEGGAPALYGAVRYRSSVPRVRRVWAVGSSVAEGDSGRRNLGFPIWLSEPAGSPVSVSFATRDGTALQGVDYVGYSGTASIAAGETDGAIQVPVFGDTLPEADETFSLDLLGAGGAVVDLPATAVGTILDDDPLPQMSVSDVRLFEGDVDSPATARFLVSLNVPSGQTVSVAYATQQGSATVGEDFFYTSGAIGLAAGSTSGTISVPIVPDDLPEADKTFSLLLFAPANVALADDLGTATILDDDSEGATSYYTVTPCRLIDTRSTWPALTVDVERVVAVAGACGIPSDARSVVLNVTVVAPTGDGLIQVYPSGAAPPDTSVVGFSAGRTRAGITMVLLGADGSLSLMCRMPGSPTGTAHAVVDVSGYFR